MFVKISRLINLYFIIIFVIHKNEKKTLYKIMHFIILKLNKAEPGFQNG